MAASLSSSSSSYRKKRRRRSKSRSHRSRRNQRWRSSSGSLPRRDERFRKKRQSTSRSTEQSSSSSSCSSSLLRKRRKGRRRSPSQSSSNTSTPAKKRSCSSGSSSSCSEANAEAAALAEKKAAKKARKIAAAAAAELPAAKEDSEAAAKAARKFARAAKRAAAAAAAEQPAAKEDSEAAGKAARKAARAAKRAVAAAAAEQPAAKEGSEAAAKAARKAARAAKRAAAAAAAQDPAVEEDEEAVAKAARKSARAAKRAAAAAAAFSAESAGKAVEDNPEAAALAPRKAAKKAKKAAAAAGAWKDEAQKAKSAKEAKGGKLAKRVKEAKIDKDAKKAKERSKKSPSLRKPNGKRSPLINDSAVRKNGSTATERTHSPPGKEAKTNGKRLPFDDAAVTATLVSAIQGRKPGTQLAGLGDLGALQRSLDEERQRLKLFVIKAKQEWEERRDRQSAGGVTDEKDYYQASVGETIGPNKQFQIVEKIGRGVFSSVFKCKDTSGGVDYAVKIIRNAKMMRRVSEKEVETYRHLSSKASKEDPDGARHIINLMAPETFEHQGHLCLVFGLLKCDLRFALKKYGMGKGLQLGTIQQYGQQLFKALRVLRRLKLIHGDLKPDNVLMSTDKTFVQLIDFGSAMNVSEHISNTPYVQPRYYRAPEVMLGIPYDTQVDVWSLGVTLFELATTKVLYQGACNNAMIKLMLEICGAFPKCLRSAGKFVTKHFNSDGDFLHRDPRDNGSQAKKMTMEHFGTHAKPLRPVQTKLQAELVEVPDGADGALHKAKVEHMAALISACCKPDHSKRITPEQALKHAFFNPPQS